WLMGAGVGTGVGLGLVGLGGLATGRAWGSLLLLGAFLAVAARREARTIPFAVLRWALGGPRPHTLGPARLLAAPRGARVGGVAGGWGGGGGGLGVGGLGGAGHGQGWGEPPLAGRLPGRGRPAGGKDHPLCGAPLGLGRAPPPHLGARPASGRAAGGPSLGGGRPARKRVV